MNIDSEKDKRDNSLYYKFSEIMLSDFVQLLPEREVVTAKNSVIVKTPAVRKYFVEGHDDPYHNVLLALGEKEKVTPGVPYNLMPGTNSTEQRSTHLIDGTDINVHYDSTIIKKVHLMEYETYGSEMPAIDHVMQDCNSADAADVRNNRKMRLVFSYTLTVD